MATVTQQFSPLSAQFQAANGAQLAVNQGTNFPVPALAFDTSTEEEVFFDFSAVSYGSGNVTVTLEWYADTASSGDVRFGAQISALTPNTDTQDIETDAFDTATEVTDSHLGTTNQRLHSMDIAITNVDSIAADDRVRLRIYRDTGDAADTMAGDCLVTAVKVSYSDT